MRHACLLKVSFFKVILVIFLCRYAKMMHTNRSYTVLFLVANTALEFIEMWDGFGQGGVTMVPMFWGM
jgi:hypothetical protein